MTQINGHALALREAYDSGIDPYTVELNNETAARGKKKTQGNHGRCFEGNFFCYEHSALNSTPLLRLPVDSF